MFTVLSCDVETCDLGGLEVGIPGVTDEGDWPTDYQERPHLEHSGALEECMYVYHPIHAHT